MHKHDWRASGEIIEISQDDVNKVRTMGSATRPTDPLIQYGLIQWKGPHLTAGGYLMLPILEFMHFMLVVLNACSRLNSRC